MNTGDPQFDERARDPGADDEEGGGFDLERAKQIAQFFIRAFKRHRRLAAGLFVGVSALVITVAALWPRTYQCDFRLLSQATTLLPELGNPNRNISREADQPIKDVQDTIVQRDNLVALVKQVDLVDRWDATRAPVQRIKDKITNALFGPLTEAERLHALVGLLEKRLWVTTDDSTISVFVSWPSPQIALELSTIVEDNFLGAKYDNEVSVITEAIRILETRAKDQAKAVDVALADLTQLEDAKKRGIQGGDAPEPTPAPAPSAQGAPTPAPAPRPRPARPAVSSTGSEVALQLEDVRKQMRTLEDLRQRQLADAQKQLSDSRMTLGPLHPTVIAETAKVDELSKPSPELAALKSQEHALVASLAGPGGDSASNDSDAVGAGASTRAPSGSFGFARPSPTATAPRADLTREFLRELTEHDDPATALAKTKLQAASAKYNEMLTRIESAQIELDVARAAFKYRYQVVHPPEFPTKPQKPNVPVLLAGGILAALLLALLAPGVLDLASGRLYEPWQVEHALKLPVLGILEPPRTGG